MVKAVIFDMDGTLIDTEKYYRIFWPMALKQFGYEMTDEQALQCEASGSRMHRSILRICFMIRIWIIIKSGISEKNHGGASGKGGY